MSKKIFNIFIFLILCLSLLPRISNAESFEKLYDFEKYPGVNPAGSLVFDYNNNKFYGVTNYGGKNSMGVLFEYDPSNNTLTNKIDFDGTTNGQYPCDSLTVYNSKLYGMTTLGGANNMGVLFEYDPSNNTLTKKMDFDGATKGSRPSNSLTVYNSKLYGKYKNMKRTLKNII